MSKAKKKTAAANPNTPKCPSCGRKSTMRKIEGQMYYCDHCNQAFAS